MAKARKTVTIGKIKRWVKKIRSHHVTGGIETAEYEDEMGDNVRGFIQSNDHT